MSARMANTFYDTLTVLDLLSMNKEGLTVGKMQKSMAACTVGQIKRMVASLELCGFIHATNEKHGRTGKTVWHMNEQAAVMLSSVSRQYVERN